MNNRSTLLLAGLVVVMGIIALFSGRQSPTSHQGTAATTGALGISAGSVQMIRVQKDYWDSFTLVYDPAGQWSFVEPSPGEALSTPVRELLTALERFPVDRYIDLPGGDTERYREYGLWEPLVKVTVTTADEAVEVLVGGETADGQGVYCAVEGQDGVMVTATQVADVLLRGMDYYRAEPETTAMSGTGGSPVSSGNNGLAVQDLQTGNGPQVQTGQRVSVHYTGRLTDGTEFDSSHNRGTPFSFQVGAGEVIPGWEQGVLGMQVGGRRRLVIPPEMAYGSQGRPPVIPANATLEFEIELLAIE